MTHRTVSPLPRRRLSGLGAVAFVVSLALALIQLSSPAAVKAANYPAPGAVSGDTHAHDPSMVKTSGGTYYVYSTHNLVEMRSSTDRIHFARVGSAFSSALSWPGRYGLTSTDLWAPDVSFHNGLYWLYYALSSFGSNNSAIGVATSTTGGPGSFTDRGLVYRSTSSNDYNAIDPSLIVDSSGRWWLSFGSWFSGIKLIQLDPSTGKQLGSNTTRYTIASRPAPDAEEASYIRQINGYFYLFVSWDHCCQGTSSNYRVMVGRSTSITGGYTDKNGVPMTSGGGSEVVASHDNIHGPGGQSVIHDTDGDLLIYHWYDPPSPTNGCGCELGINLMGYSNGWPYIH